MRSRKLLILFLLVVILTLLSVQAVYAEKPAQPGNSPGNAIWWRLGFPNAHVFVMVMAMERECLRNPDQSFCVVPM